MKSPPTPQSPSSEGPANDFFRAIFDAEGQYVWKTLRRLGARPSDTEDLASEVWLTVHRRLDTYDRGRPIRPWLFGIAFRVVTAERRLAHHRREVLADGDTGGHRPEDRFASPAPAADEQLSAQDAHRLVLDALQLVDVDRRAILVMHDMDDAPMKEIAETLGVPVNTAYSRLRLGREDLKQAITRLRQRRTP
jgi:RNA polymerase sigma-70 factor (ECF subfamily)